MLNLNDVYFFVQVVDKKGFSAAGKALNLPKSSLSRRILQLEAKLGARLIQRTSRRFVVTDAGQEFYEHGQAMLAEAEAAEQSVRRRVSEPQGAVRITCSVAVAQFVVAELLPKFVEQFPKVDVVQHATNRYVDLVEEGFDLALRAHSQPLPNSSLIGRPIASTPWGLFAGASYVQQHGLPTSPGDLANHTGLLLTGAKGDCCWRLSRGSHEEDPIHFKPKLCSDDIITLKRAAESGLGIVALPIYLCQPQVLEGKFVRLLPDWTAGKAIVTMLSPSRRGLLPSVRALSNFLAIEFQSIVSACSTGG
jgi:DNA-binding transcriptional LysR family regulator